MTLDTNQEADAIKRAVIECRDRARIAEREVLDAAAQIADEFKEDEVTIQLSNGFMTLSVVKPPLSVQDCEARAYRNMGWTNDQADEGRIKALPFKGPHRVLAINPSTDLTIDDFNLAYWLSNHGDC